MTGLEKMVSQIVDEAKAEAESRLNTAREEADKIVSEAKAEADKLLEQKSEQSETSAANYLERIKSSADLQAAPATKAMGVTEILLLTMGTPNSLEISSPVFTRSLAASYIFA